MLTSQTDLTELMSAELANATDTVDQYNQMLEVQTKLQGELNDVERNALETQFGVYRRNYVISLLENFEKIGLVVQDMDNAMGYSAQQNSRYMETFEAKIQQFITSLKQLAVQAGKAGLLDIAKLFIDAATAVTNLIKNTGGLIPVIILLATAYTRLRNEAAQAAVAATAANAATAATAGNAARIGMLSQAMASLRTASVAAGGGLVGVGAGIASLIGPIGIIVLGVQGLIGAYNLLDQAVEKSITQSKELRDSFVSDQKAASNNLQSLEKLREEYDELSKSVGRNGEQGSLTADQYDRYKSVVAQILEMHPSLIDGYNSEGEAISNRNDLLEEAIRLQKEEIRLRKETYISDEQSNVIQGYRDQIALYQKDINEALRGTTRFSKDVLDIFAGTSFAGPETVSTITSILDKFDLSIGKLESGAREYQELLVERRSEIVSSLSAELGYTDEQLAAVNSLIDKVETGLRGIRVEASKISTELVDFAAFSPETQDWYSAFAGEYETYLDELKNKINEVATDVSGWENQKKAVDEFGRSIKDALDNMPLDKVQELKDQLSSGAITADEFRAAVERYKAELEAAGSGTDAYSNAVVVVVSDLDDFADAHERAAASTSTATSTLGQWISTLSGVPTEADKVTSAITNLESAMQKLKDSKGLTLDELLSLVETYPELASAMDYSTGELLIHTDALEAERQKLYEVRAALVATEIETLIMASGNEGLITSFQKLVDDLNDATTAEQRFAIMAQIVQLASSGAAADIDGMAAAAFRLNAVVNEAMRMTFDFGSSVRGSADAIKAQTDAINEQIKALQNQQKEDDKATSKRIKNRQNEQKEFDKTNKAEIKGLQNLQKEAEKASKTAIESLKEQHKIAQENFKEQEKSVKSRYDAEIQALKDLKTEASREDAREDYLKSREELLAERAEQEKRTSREAVERIKEIDKALVDLDEQEERRLRDIGYDEQISAIEDRRDAEIEAIKAAADAEDKRYEARLKNLEAEATATKESYQLQIEALQGAAEIRKEENQAEIDALRAKQEVEKEATEAKIEALRAELEAAKKANESQVAGAGAVGDANQQMAERMKAAIAEMYQTMTEEGKKWADDAIARGMELEDVYNRLVQIKNSLETTGTLPSWADPRAQWYSREQIQVKSSHTGSVVKSDGLVNVAAGEIIVREDISKGLMQLVELFNKPQASTQAQSVQSGQAAINITSPLMVIEKQEISSDVDMQRHERQLNRMFERFLDDLARR